MRDPSVESQPASYVSSTRSDRPLWQVGLTLLQATIVQLSRLGFHGSTYAEHPTSSSCGLQCTACFRQEILKELRKFMVLLWRSVRSKN